MYRPEHLWFKCSRVKPFGALFGLMLQEGVHETEMWHWGLTAFPAETCIFLLIMWAVQMEERKELWFASCTVYLIISYELTTVVTLKIAAEQIIL